LLAAFWRLVENSILVVMTLGSWVVLVTREHRSRSTAGLDDARDLWFLIKGLRPSSFAKEPK